MTRQRAHETKSSLTKEEIESFRSTLGCLMWLAVCTRIDLAYHGATLARFVGDLRVRHLLRLNKTVRRALRVPDIELWFQRLQQTNPTIPTLLDFSDSSLQNEEDPATKERTDTQQGQFCSRGVSPEGSGELCDGLGCSELSFLEER